MEKSNEITMLEYKQLLKIMLKDLHNICMTNQLKYFVAYGTLIGAVRHDGFIPWDDDVDVCMPREDYEQLVKIISQGNYPYYMLTPENSLNYYNNFSRFCSNKGYLTLKGTINIDNLGPFIDVIPLDKVPEDHDERQRYYTEITKYYSMIRNSLPSRYYKTLHAKRYIKIRLNLVKRIYGKYVIGIEKAKRKRQELILKYKNEETRMLSGTFDRLSDKMIVYQDEISTLELHKFEDIDVMIPSKYDDILTRTYGDYMKLPPADERISLHHFTPFWK